MKKRIWLLLAAVLLLLAGCARDDYEQAQTLYQAGDYRAAAEAFDALGDYEDSARMAAVCRYAQAMALFEAGEYTEASREFTLLEDYEDSRRMVLACQYALAEKLYDAGDLLAAEASFAALGDYEDSRERADRCRYELAGQLLAGGEYLEAAQAYGELGDYADAAQRQQDARWLALQNFISRQEPSVTVQGVRVYLSSVEDDPQSVTLWAEKTLDLGFYSVTDRCGITLKRGQSQGHYQLLTETQTYADGLTGYTRSSASDTVELAALTADTQLPLANFYYYGQDVYGNVTERTEPWLGERERFDEIRGMLAVLLEQVPALLEQSGTAYTLQELGLTGLEA